MSTPRVSVAMCTCNGARFLREQLQSIVDQTRPPDELVICDDASTDQTAQLLQQFLHGSRIPTRIVINPANLGTTRNFDQAISLCRGDLVFLADQDDVWLPEKIERLVAAFDRPHSPVMVFSDAYAVDVDRKRLDYRLWDSLGFSSTERARFVRGDATRILLHHNVVAGATLAFQRSACAYVLPINTQWVHDAWIALLLSATGACGAIDQPLIHYRQHASQQIGCTPQSRTQRIRLALSFSAAHYRAVAQRYVAARERLHALRPMTPTLDAAVALISDKIAHFTARADLLDGTMPRVRTAVREWRNGRYQRYSLGLQSLARDVLRY